MPRVSWPLYHDCPCVQITLTLTASGQAFPRTLLADTGAGSRYAGFELILEEDDCLHCGGFPGASITLGGAYSGLFPVYDLRVQVPALGFDRNVRAVGVSSVPPDF